MPDKSTTPSVSQRIRRSRSHRATLGWPSQAWHLPVCLDPSPPLLLCPVKSQLVSLRGAPGRLGQAQASGTGWKAGPERSQPVSPPPCLEHPPPAVTCLCDFGSHRTPFPGWSQELCPRGLVRPSPSLHTPQGGSASALAHLWGASLLCVEWCPPNPSIEVLTPVSQTPNPV